MKIALTFFLLFIANFCFSQKKFKIISTETDTAKGIYIIVDESNNIVKKLDSSVYVFIPRLNSYGYFAVAQLKGKHGWKAININEKILFNVALQYEGEIYPDSLIENKIRIVDNNRKFGFADKKGKYYYKTAI